MPQQPTAHSQVDRLQQPRRDHPTTGCQRPVDTLLTGVQEARPRGHAQARSAFDHPVCRFVDRTSISFRLV